MYIHFYEIVTITNILIKTLLKHSAAKQKESGHFVIQTKTVKQIMKNSYILT